MPFVDPIKNEEQSTQVLPGNIIDKIGPIVLGRADGSVGVSKIILEPSTQDVMLIG
jgi:hypothetical protein